MKKILKILILVYALLISCGPFNPDAFYTKLHSDSSDQVNLESIDIEVAAIVQDNPIVDESNSDQVSTLEEDIIDASEEPGDLAKKISTSIFKDIKIYNVRGSCPQGQLVVEIELELEEGVSVNNVTIQTENTSINDINGNNVNYISMLKDNVNLKKWTFGGFGNESVCVDFNKTYEFSINAHIEGSDDITIIESKKFMDIPAAKITIKLDQTEYTQEGQNNPETPIAITENAQSFKWTPNAGTPDPNLEAQDGSKIKFFFDISHFNIKTGGPDNKCQMQTSEALLYDLNSVLSSFECDVDKCNNTTGDENGTHVCRIHVQTVLVDTNDNTLGWGAGSDLYFCVKGQSNCSL
jgi:hypothetical protein